MSTPETTLRVPKLPILTLLHPRAQTRAVVAALILGLLAAVLAVRLVDVPVWGASARAGCGW